MITFDPLRHLFPKSRIQRADCSEKLYLRGDHIARRPSLNFADCNHDRIERIHVAAGDLLQRRDDLCSHSDGVDCQMRMRRVSAAADDPDVDRVCSSTAYASHSSHSAHRHPGKTCSPAIA